MSFLTPLTSWLSDVERGKEGRRNGAKGRRRGGSCVGKLAVEGIYRLATGYRLWVVGCWFYPLLSIYLFRLCSDPFVKWDSDFVYAQMDTPISSRPFVSAMRSFLHWYTVEASFYGVISRIGKHLSRASMRLVPRLIGQINHFADFLYWELRRMISRSPRPAPNHHTVTKGVALGLSKSSLNYTEMESCKWKYMYVMDR